MRPGTLPVVINAAVQRLPFLTNIVSIFVAALRLQTTASIKTQRITSYSCKPIINRLTTLFRIKSLYFTSPERGHLLRATHTITCVSARLARRSHKRRLSQTIASTSYKKNNQNMINRFDEKNTTVCYITSPKALESFGTLSTGVGHTTLHHLTADSRETLARHFIPEHSRVT